MIRLVYTETNNLTIDTRRIIADGPLGYAVFNACSRIVITDDSGAELLQNAKNALKSSTTTINVIIDKRTSGITSVGVLTSNISVYVNSFNSAIKYARELETHDDPLVITIFGTCIIEAAFAARCIDELFAIVVVKGVYDLLHAHKDVYKLNLGRIWSLVENEKHNHIVGARVDAAEGIIRIESRFICFEETRYLQLVANCMDGFISPNRTGISTRTVVGRIIEFNLTDSDQMIVPLLTTRRISFKSIMVELLAFINADTTTARMKSNGVRIWNGNSSRAFHKLNGRPDYEDGELGPIYGYQWRSWNKRYDHQPTTGREHEYEHEHEHDGIDQLAEVIEAIKTDPFSRRHIVSAWNPEQIPCMALPPCHFSFQFIVRESCSTEHDDMPRRWLDCVVNMRSSDTVLGLPFNIVSYAVLTHIVAKLTGNIAGNLVMMLAHTHVYENHIEGVCEQMTRMPRRFPALRFGCQARDATTIDEFGACDWRQFEIVGYNPYDAISFQMAI